MRNFFAALTILLIAVGFLVPLAWVAAAISLVLAIGSRPPGRRPDGKKRTGGLLGDVWDDVVIGYKMTDCPYCRAKISRDAKKCPHCAEWVVPVTANGRPVPSVKCGLCSRPFPTDKKKVIAGTVICPSCYDTKLAPQFKTP